MRTNRQPALAPHAPPACAAGGPLAAPPPHRSTTHVSSASTWPSPTRVMVVRWSQRNCTVSTRNMPDGHLAREMGGPSTAACREGGGVAGGQLPAPVFAACPLIPAMCPVNSDAAAAQAVHACWQQSLLLLALPAACRIGLRRMIPPDLARNPRSGAWGGTPPPAAPPTRRRAPPCATPGPRCGSRQQWPSSP